VRVSHILVARRSSRSSSYFDHIDSQRGKHDPAVDLYELVDARPSGAGADPAALAIEQELPALVAQAKEQLSDRSRWICDQVAAGKSIPDLARDLAVTIKMAKDARERAFAEFRAVWLRMFGRGYEHPC